MRPLLSPFKSSLMLILLAYFISDICTAQVLGLGRARQALAVRAPDGPQTSSEGLPAIFTAITVAYAHLSIAPILTDVVSPCTDANCATATASPTKHACDSARDDAAQVKGLADFDIICDIDFPGQNIYPFILAGSFEKCLTSCQEYNEDHNDTNCAGFVYAPERSIGADDCYLKSSLNEPAPATIHLIGATLTTTASQSTPAASTASVVLYTSAAGEIPDAAESPASKPKIGIVTVREVKELGSSTNNPTKQYVSHPPIQPIKLASEITVPGVNTDLLHDYDMASDTGIWSSKDFVLEASLEDMKTAPQLSRDGGKGGMVNGTNIFVFCDTGVYSDGEFVAFVSSSVATDQSLNAREDKSIELVDHIGQWQDDVGRMRGFAPMTEGEEAYNKAVSGEGYRYAVWPETAPISLNLSTALLYASLVYDEVDMDNVENYNLTYFGNTLLKVQMDPTFGPYAERIVPQLFKANEIPFGSLAGVRAWGRDGWGGNEGEILLFGKSPDHNNPGVFAAKTNPQGFTDLATYTYWNGREWTKQVPSPYSTEGCIFNMSIVDLDIIYIPKARTFLMVYTVFPPDNTFYFRQLYPHSDHTVGTYRPYEQDGDDHYADTIVTGEWGAQKTLFKVPTPAVGTMYAGGVHAGYFGREDIAEGGDSVLLTWTEHTGNLGESSSSGYAHKVSRVRVNYLES